MLYDDDQSILFRQNGYYRCFMTIDGPFPDWYAAIRVTLRDRKAFMNFAKQEFKYPDDFDPMAARTDEIESGGIILDRENNTATVSFNMIDGYSYSEAANGAYDLTKPRYYKSGDKNHQPRIDDFP
jgi:hypothetical protein